MLIAMSGLPGAGKSLIADALATRLPCFVLSVDLIEAALWTAGVSHTEPTGLAAYVVAEVIGQETLNRGQTVIIDAVNAVDEARQQWRSLAARAGVALRIVEVQCSDLALHRRRVESRHRDIPGMNEVTWDQVQAQRAAFQEWTEERLVLDAAADLDANITLAVAYCRG